MNAGLILLVCGFVGLAIAIKLFSRSRDKSRAGQRWVTKDLYRGDLHALADMVCGSGLDVTYHQIDRLIDRGFVKNNLWGTRSSPLKGKFPPLPLKKTPPPPQKKKTKKKEGQKLTGLH